MKPHKSNPPDDAKVKAKPATPWAERWRSAVPSRDSLASHPWLKPIAHHVLDPKLWRMQHESVARGAAIGIFWAFVLPAGQILAAAAHSVWWRANIPVAAAMTLITNPLTIGFWLWLAYQTGSTVLDAPPPQPFKQLGEGGGILDYVSAIGAPAILGMGIFATFGAVAAYALVKVVWHLKFRIKQKNRADRRNKLPR